jgi:Domain of unknown function (DUF5658)
MTNLKSGEAMPYIHFFVYLQVLDLLTTLVGLKFGVSEASPFVRWLMTWGPAAGVAASKIVAVALAGLCIVINKHHLVRWITYWYAGLVVWNLCTILAGAHAVSVP